MSEFTTEELDRYHRQLMLPEIGIEGQKKLQNAKVLVVGAGGLGCPVLQYLCAAGVGTIGIVDLDKVELHNLHRQVLYSLSDVGKPKAETAAEKLRAHNPNVEITAYNTMLNSKNCETLFSEYDIVVDCTDNFPSRYLISDACVKLNKTEIYGSIYNFEAQVAVFNYKGGFNLRNIFPEPPEPEDTPGCNENGVLGVIPGIAGLYMANGCLQVILEIYNSPSLLLIDTRNFTIKKLAMSTLIL